VALVTGGGSGIGRATARLLGAEGATVIVVGRRQAPLDEAVREITAAGGRSVARTCDLERSGEPRALGEWAVKTFRCVDILINNAGHSSRVRSVRWVGEEEWQSVLAVNLNAVYALTQALLPPMIERGEGTIVTVSSVSGIRPGLLGGAPYGAAKAAVRNLMGQVHAELRNKGIRVTTIMPGEVDTPVLDTRPLPPDADARAAMMRAEDIAAAIMFCVTLPPRTVVEEMIINATFERDRSAEIDAARRAGERSR
jgi:NADP-dependent 3-hydroxy acid dehydrogenase YdfG